MTQPSHSFILIPLQFVGIHPTWQSHGPGNVWETCGMYQRKMLSTGMGNRQSKWSWAGPQLLLLWPVATFLLSNKKMKKIIDVWPGKCVWKTYLSTGNWECRIFTLSSLLNRHVPWLTRCTPFYNLWNSILCFLQQNYKIVENIWVWIWTTELKRTITLFGTKIILKAGLRL